MRFNTALSALLLFASASHAEAVQSRVEVALTGADSISTVQLQLNFDQRLGTFRGSRDAVSCTPNPDLKAMFAFNQCDPEAKDGCREAGQLNAAMITPQPISGPVTLFTCDFDAQDKASAPNFQVKVIDSGTTIAGRVAQREAAVAVAVSPVLAEEVR